MTKNNILYFVLFYIFSHSLYADNLEYNLTEAINRGDFQHAKQLISMGADVNKKQEPFMQTPLISAPLRGLAFVKLLIENGADINSRDQDNTTALINACLYGKKEVAEYLISKGADLHDINNDGISVIEAAKLSNNKNLIIFIRSKFTN